MKVLIYAEAVKLIKISGIGCAVSHQQTALQKNRIPFTRDLNDNYDIVHINTYGPYSRFLAKKAKKEGKTVVYHAHSTEEDFCNSFIGSNLIAPFFKKYIVSCYNLGDVIVTPTTYSKQLLEGYGIKKPIYAVSNGIDRDFYRKRVGDRDDFRKQFGFSENDKVIMSVGLYIERKGILDFVELAKKMPECKFIWFGKTPLYSVPHKIRKAVRTKLPNLIFAGFVTPDQLKKAYHGADAFAFLTQEETEGIVLLEAIASKQQVLIRDIPIYKDWFTDGVNIHKAKNIDEMQQKLTSIVNKTASDLTTPAFNSLENLEIKSVGNMLYKVYNEALTITAAEYSLLGKRIDEKSAVKVER